jgi:hypothetical protein
VSDLILHEEIIIHEQKVKVIEVILPLPEKLKVLKMHGASTVYFSVQLILFSGLFL